MRPKDNKVLGFFSNIRLLIILIVLIAIFSLINNAYFSFNNFYSILMSVALIGFACVGQSLCLLVGGFDLSVGSIGLLAGVMSAILIRNFGINPWIVVLIILLQSLVIGIINGFVITKGYITPLIATLAMSYIIIGLSYLLTKGSVIGIQDDEFRLIGTYRIFGIRVLQLPIVILLFIFVIFYLILKYTNYGKYIYATGGNITGAKFSGIKVNLIIGSVYALSGLLSGFGGILSAARVGAAQPNIGTTFTIFSIAAAVIGGISLKGGRGSIAGTLVGILVVQSLIIGLLGVGLEPYYQYIAIGLVLIFAVFLDIFGKKQL
jgi:ribose/xylose/arabinose/galactoside ABC-type transport system permease subunit